MIVSGVYGSTIRRCGTKLPFWMASQQDSASTTSPVPPCSAARRWPQVRRPRTLPNACTNVAHIGGRPLARLHRSPPRLTPAPSPTVAVALVAFIAPPHPSPPCDLFSRPSSQSINHHHPLPPMSTPAATPRCCRLNRCSLPPPPKQEGPRSATADNALPGPCTHIGAAHPAAPQRPVTGPL